MSASTSEEASTSDDVTTHPPEENGSLVTSWLPMSTAWPSSSGCGDYWWKVVESTVAAWDPGYGLSVDTDLTCQPPQLTAWWNADMSVDVAETQMSIGPVVCPEAYTTANTQVRVVNGESRTLVACCPSSYSFRFVASAGDTNQCASDLEEGQVIEFVTSNIDSSTWLPVTSTLTEASVVWGIQVNGWLFPEASTSVSSDSTTASSDTTSASLDSTSLQTSAAATQTSDTEASGDSGLSTGAKAGIGAGVGIVALGAIAVAAFLLLRRRRTRGNSGQDKAPGTGYSQPPSEVYGSQKFPDYTRSAELPEARRPVELP
ncbi:hypothetical protein B0J13DRAFT_558795 [Dactylonectria estremocensis]|uniref:Uncharacterized protein n=1 Tax=Dactylonectria estremocensis TaxID=1079267 RepID=A0A9P9EMY8_9HYPO|nr:hypothetical protein B0J13DRAFT_558795 [Dactylonectria estremocensis]